MVGGEFTVPQYNTSHGLSHLSSFLPFVCSSCQLVCISYFHYRAHIFLSSLVLVLFQLRFAQLSDIFLLLVCVCMFVWVGVGRVCVVRTAHNSHE